jgi:predicted porin
VLELRANGTSGPYALLGDGAIVNSEKVEIITRDRNALGQVVRVESFQRFVDYEIEPFNRALLFKAPVASFDANLNPRFIKVTYEVDQGGEPFWIAGLDTLIKVNDSVTLGGLVHKDHNPLQPLSVYGLSMMAKTTEFSTVTAELAATDRHGVASLTGTSGQGGAGRIVFKQDDPKNHTQITISAAKTGIEFDNPTSSMPAGRVEIKGIAKQKINADHVLLAEGNDSNDLIQGNQRKNYALKLESQLAPQTRLTLSMNAISERVVSSKGVQSDDLTTLGAKIQTGVDALPGLGVYVEAEQSIDDASRRMLAVGGEYKLPSNTRLYGRYEVIDDLRRLTNPLADTRPGALVGVEHPFSVDGRAFTEYRARDGTDGPLTEAAIGLRQTFKLSEDWRVTGSFEKVEPLSEAATASASVAATVGLEYLNDHDLKYTGRVERREAASANSWLLQQGMALRHDDKFTSLGRLYWNHQSTLTAADIERWRVLVGIAYRDDVQDDLNWLARIERKHESNPTASTPFVRDAWIVGLHTNYRLGRGHTLTQHWAYKWSNERFAQGLTNHSRIGLAFLRYTHNLTERVDLDVHGGVMWQNKLSNRKTGLGIEAGYMLTDNLWLSAGYNWFGFHDADLTASDYTQRGPYVRMRWKFDENLFRNEERATTPLQ